MGSFGHLHGARRAGLRHARGDVDSVAHGGVLERLR